MKRAAIILTSLLIAFVTGCQDHVLEPHPVNVIAWKAGGPNHDLGQSIATDRDGNVYVAGSFLGTITLGSVTLTYTGAEDIFLAKYNSSGDLLWAKRFVNTNNDRTTEMIVDGDGNIYMTGVFAGTLSFGSSVLTSNGKQDIFIVKFNSNGEVQWAHNEGGMEEDGGRGIAVDKSGAVYITGEFAGTAHFGSTVLSANGPSDGFIAKYNTIGDIQWARGTGGTNRDYGNSIAIDDNSNVYVTGTFYETISFGSTTLTSDIVPDIFIAKYNSNGEVLWAQQTKGSGQIGGNKIATDVSGNVYVTGYFTSSALSRSVMFGTTELTTAGDLDIFLAKYNTNGELQWAQRAGGPSYDYVSGLAIDKNGDVYLTGVFEISAMYGSINIISNGSSDVFITKYSSSGDTIWAQNAGGTNADTGLSITIDENGTVYVTGGFQGTATFGTTTLTSSGGYDVFVAKYKQ